MGSAGRLGGIDFRLGELDAGGFGQEVSGVVLAAGSRSRSSDSSASERRQSAGFLGPKPWISRSRRHHWTIEAASCGMSFRVTTSARAVNHLNV